MQHFLENSAECRDRWENHTSQNLIASINFEKWHQRAPNANFAEADAYLPSLELHFGEHGCDKPKHHDRDPILISADSASAPGGASDSKGGPWNSVDSDAPVIPPATTVTSADIAPPPSNSVSDATATSTTPPPESASPVTSTTPPPESASSAAVTTPSPDTTSAATSDSTGVRYAGFATHWGEDGAGYANPVTAVQQMYADGATMFRDNYSQGNTALDTAVETASNLGMTPQIIVANPEQATEAAEEYKGYNVQFETPNEPNTAYDQNASDWATSAASTAASYALESAQIANNIHAIDPTAKVDVGSVSVAGVGWAPGDTFTTDLVQDLKNNNTLGDFNAISIHPYGGESLGAAGTAADIATLHQQINNIAGKPLQLDISEVGSTDEASTYLPQLETDLSKQSDIGMFDSYQWAGQASNNDAAYQIEGTPAEAALSASNAIFKATPLSSGTAP